MNIENIELARLAAELMVASMALAGVVLVFLDNITSEFESYKRFRWVILVSLGVSFFGVIACAVLCVLAIFTAFAWLKFLLLACVLLILLSFSCISLFALRGIVLAIKRASERKSETDKS